MFWWQRVRRWAGIRHIRYGILYARVMNYVAYWGWVTPSPKDVAYLESVWRGREPLTIFNWTRSKRYSELQNYNRYCIQFGLICPACECDDSEPDTMLTARGGKPVELSIYVCCNCRLLLREMVPRVPAPAVRGE